MAKQASREMVCEGNAANMTCGTRMSKHKPIEIYSFIDPVCPECWGLEPIIKKLFIEYGDYFTIRHVIGSQNKRHKPCCTNGDKQKIANKWERTASLTGMSCDGDFVFEKPLPSSYKAAVAVKAAELQGKGYGRRFLRILREQLFLRKHDINDEQVLLESAVEAGLDEAEFKQDLHSQGPIKALQCDRKITDEMDVDALPTLVFFNINDDQEGIKVQGSYPYQVYVHILEELLGEKPEAVEPPTMLEFIKHYQFVATKELEVVFGKEPAEIEHELKKLVLKQQIQRVPVKYGTFWRYAGAQI